MEGASFQHPQKESKRLPDSGTLNWSNLRQNMAQHEEPLNIVQEEILTVEELPENEIDQVDDNEELYEEITGKIMQAEDGRFFVATDVNTADVDFDTINKIEVVVNLDGTETVIFEADAVSLDDQVEAEVQSKDMKDNILIANISGRSNHILDPQIEIGAMATADDVENGMYLHGYDDPDLKYGRRNRKHGKAVCPECNQSFVNTARLERHLSVHQIFGAFLCQLCGKTYKYEYNLFYHWRKTCRDLAEMIPEEERKKIEVNELREVVENLAAKKAIIGNNMELGISTQPLFRNMGVEALDDSRRSKRHVMCQACGVNILAAHMPKHRNVHNGSSAADQPSVAGGHFCDLCGLIYRHKPNLYKHWRTNCSEIMANLPEEADLAMDDAALRRMVEDLLKKYSIDVVDEKVCKNDAERARALDSLTADLNIDLTGIPEGEDTEDEAQNANMFDQKWIENHGIIFADDLPEGSPYLDMARGVGTHPFGQSGSKFPQLGEVLQCPECFKPFMSVSRLEKHMAGYHASSGTHHCPLCGNRFKYDYNLLYHYRRSCPYTKAFIERDVREQIDSTSLRKLVRNLAVQQPSLPMNFSSRMNSINQNDAFVHKQMMQFDSDGKMPVTKINPSNVQPPRPGLPHGYRCPHCNIVFYGTTSIKLHMKMRHQEEFEVKQNDEIVQEEIITEMPNDTLIGEDMPPKLELEEHKPMPRHRIYDEQGNDITNTPEVQQLIASGEIQFNEGEEIILVDQESGVEHLEYFEPELIQQKPTSNRQRPLRGFPSVEVSLNEEAMSPPGTSTRRSTRLSRSYGNKDHEEMETDANESDFQASNESGRKAVRRKKDDVSPAPAESPSSRRSNRPSESSDFSPRRSLRSRR